MVDSIDTSVHDLHLQTLSDDALSMIWNFLGPGHYRYVGGTSKRLQESYLHSQLSVTNNLEGSLDNSQQQEHYERRRKRACWTHPSAIVASPSCAKIYLDDHRSQSPRQQQLFRTREDRMALMPTRKNGWMGQWLINDTSTRSDDIFVLYLDILRLAAFYGQERIFAWIMGMDEYITTGTHERARLLDCTDICKLAALSGNTQMLDLARTGYGFDWDESTCNAAAWGGHHATTLEYAIQHYCSYTSWTCTLAARNGHLETLKWLRSHGCPWDEQTIDLATKFAHDKVVRFARENGCPEP